MKGTAHALFVLLVATICLAGGPDPGVRRRVLGHCGNGEACIPESLSVGVTCDIPDADGLGDDFCGCTDRQCRVEGTGVFTGELTISINQDCPDALPGARVTMHLSGETDGRVGFEAATNEPLDFCDVDIESSCTFGGASGYRTPFFCSQDRNDVFPDRLEETLLPPPDWLVLHPLPASVARTVRAAFGGDGTPVITRAEQCAVDTGTPDGSDGLPVTRTYCIKGELARLPVPLADCDPGRQATCVAGARLPSEGGVIGSTTGADPEGRFAASCGGETAPEVLFDWVPDRSGLAVFSTVGSTTNFGSMIYVLDGACAEQSPVDFRELACQGNDSFFFPACTEACCNVTFFSSVLELDRVEKGRPYCVVVDSGFGEAGIFDLSVGFCPEAKIDASDEEARHCAAPPPGCSAGATDAILLRGSTTSPFTPVPCTSPCCRPTCGDGERDPGEECDDGNAIAGDGCSDCRREANYRCAPPVEQRCGGPSCLSSDREAPCCGFFGECTLADGSVCFEDFTETCCEGPDGRYCCRLWDSETPGTIVCTDGGDGEVCSTNPFGGVCRGLPSGPPTCSFGAEPECELGPSVCSAGVTAGATTVGSSVLLSDYLGGGEFAVRRSDRLCLPADELLPDGLRRQAVDPRTALQSYGLRAMQSRVAPPAVRLTDEFHLQGVVVELRRTKSLLVPTATATGAEPPPPHPDSHGVDYYRCVDVALARDFCARSTDRLRTCNRDDDCAEEGPCINRQRVARPTNAFSTAVDAPGARLGRIKRLCLATTLDGSVARDDRLHLACYRAANRLGPCVGDACDPLFTSNVLGTGRFEARQPRETCVPARVDLYPVDGFCGDGVVDAGLGEQCDPPADSACHGRCLESNCTCGRPSPVSEDLTTCNPPVLDAWEFEVSAGEAVVVTADTVAAESAADLCVFGECSSDEFGADDNVDCTFPPPFFACPLAEFVATGSGECAVRVGVCSDACADPGTAGYRLRVTRDGVDALLRPLGDDRTE